MAKDDAHFLRDPLSKRIPLVEYRSVPAYRGLQDSPKHPAVKHIYKQTKITKNGTYHVFQRKALNCTSIEAVASTRIVRPARVIACFLDQRLSFGIWLGDRLGWRAFHAVRILRHHGLLSPCVALRIGHFM